MRLIVISVFACLAATLMSCAVLPVDTAGDRAAFSRCMSRPWRPTATATWTFCCRPMPRISYSRAADRSRGPAWSSAASSRPLPASVRFAEYVDVVAPVVHVSADGTTGWVIAQVRARGTEVGGADRSSSNRPGSSSTRSEAAAAPRGQRLEFQVIAMRTMPNAFSVRTLTDLTTCWSAHMVIRCQSQIAAIAALSETVRALNHLCPPTCV